MNLKKLLTEKRTLRIRLVIGIIIGALYACTEYIIRSYTAEPEPFLSLLIKATAVGALISESVIIFQLLTEHHFAQKTFLYQVLVKSIFYTACTTFWLVLTNSIWFAVNGGQPFYSELIEYLTDNTYLINLLTIFLIIVLLVVTDQVNSLHRKGELANFVLGRYHRPSEVERIFCFIDLKGSTTIAEKLGHFGFANFLKDYYSDISEALRKTRAEIYQYVGDEIVLSWSYKNGLNGNQAVLCFFKMKQIIRDLKSKYMSKYGVYPEFRAGIHGGPVIVTWVGELKKEIVYIGDVLNTAARIQESCKRFSRDFLISEDLLNKIPAMENIKATFVEEIIPRGKENPVRLYSLEQV